MIKYLLVLVSSLAVFGASPFSVPGTVSVLYNKTNRTVTPNGLSLIMSTNYSTNLDGGVLANGSIILRELNKRFNEVKNVEDYGATPNDGADDTEAIKRAYDAVVTAGGGTIFFPRNGYEGSLTITNDGISLLGIGSTDVNVTTNYTLIPFNTTNDVIKVGNDTGYVNGFKMQGMSIGGKRGSVYSASCLNFAGGSHGARVDGCEFIYGTNTIIFKTGITYPSTLNVVSRFSAWGGLRSTIYVDDTRSGNPNSFTTGSYLSDGYINGAANTTNAIEVVRGILNVENIYLDARSGQAILLTTGGRIRGNNADLENLLGGAGNLVTIYFPGEVFLRRNLGEFITGANVYTQGSVRWIDNTGTNTTQLPDSPNDLHGMFNNVGIGNATLALPMGFGTSINPNDRVFYFDMAGTNGPLWFRRTDNGTIIWVDKTLIKENQVDGGNTNSFWEVDFPSLTNADANIRFFRGTATSGGRYVSIFKGDGTSAQAHLFNGNGDSFINALTGRLGVGTSSPTQTLDVNGTIYCQGALYMGNDNIRDIGTLTTNRPRSIYVGTALNIGPLTSKLLRTDASGFVTNVAFGAGLAFDGETLNSTAVVPTNSIAIQLSNPTTTLTTGTSKNFYPIYQNCTIKTGKAHVLVSSSSGSVTMDLKKNGITILSAPVSIAAGSTNATLSFASTALVAGDILTGDVTGAGTGTKGAILQFGVTVP